MARATPRYSGQPASARASAAARGASKKKDTNCELLLRRAVFALGLRYRVDVAGLPGRPDLMFRKAKVVVFCDGDFWHGRDLGRRLQRLKDGHNPRYWLGKISRNVERDREQTILLERDGWTVLRFWESDIIKRAAEIALEISRAVTAGRS
jgi:DNA mismatch endonuclease (patch repair protein)